LGIAALLASLLLAGCGDINLDPTDNTARTIMLGKDRPEALTFKEGMVWCYDQFARRCLRLPPGVYKLEGEDADFRYFRAPEPMDFRFLDKPENDRQRFIPGGVALRKSFDLLLPAEVYIDSDKQPPEEKVLIFKLGHNFADMEGHAWARNF
jgi:hypothetical protein